MQNFKRDGGGAMVSRQKFGFRTRQVESVVPVLVTATLLAPNNPDRVFMQTILEGAFAVTVGRNAQVTTASGTPMSTTGDAIAFTPENDGEATGYERWAIANGGTSNVRLVETMRIWEGES